MMMILKSMGLTVVGLAVAVLVAGGGLS